MPLRITPSKRPLPVAKRSSLRNKSYEVEPVPGRKVYPSREYPVPVRPPPLSDQEASAFPISRPQIPPESVAETSLVLADPMQPPPEVASDSAELVSPSWQVATSRRTVRATRRTLNVSLNDDVMIDSTPASAVPSPPASAATSSVSTVCSLILYVLYVHTV